MARKAEEKLTMNTKQAIAAAKADYSAGRIGVAHRVGLVTYTSEKDGVYRYERNDNGGTTGIRQPNRKLA